MVKRKDTVLRLIKTVKGSPLLLLASFVFSVLTSAFGMFIPYLFGKAIDCMGEGTVDFEELLMYLLICVALIGLVAVTRFALTRIDIRIAYDTTTKIRNMSYGKIRKLPVSFIDSTPVGNIQSMIINDCETVGDGLIMFLDLFFSGITSIVITFIIMLTIDVKTALLVLLFTPLSFIVSYFIASRSFGYFKKQSGIRARQTSYITEMTSNFRTIHVFDTADKICDDFDNINDEYRTNSVKATFVSSLTNPSTRFVNALIYAVVALIGAKSALAGAVSVGALASLLAYSAQYMKPFNDIASVFTELSDSFACLGRIFTFLDEEELPPEDKKKRIFDGRGDFEIEFCNVTFSYVPGNPVIKDVSFKVPPGTSCAIVGPTGCGKTTLINLLMRFYEPDSGKILVNGRDIKEISREELRSYIGVVTQDTWFKNGTILENITYGKPDTSEEDAIKASSVSGAHSFIRKLPNKYREELSSSRDDISEGQRQLLAITRAMVSDPSILILDEATSSVDILTEVRIQRAVRELLQGRTGLCIAHRLSTIVDADMIVVMENGRISEIGNHKELIGKGGFYSKLYGSYTDGSILEERK
ncbi:MAG TPA: sugar ABC transporter ATP-binding protein [Clostridiales bacterium]|nr:sugar ABC transporter ATP-binding protein [Clostridiales bacterium]